MVIPARHLLAVIPARIGSRRVPRKNIRDLLGRPAIAYTIEAAIESGLFEQVVVSTDSEEIAAVARDCGASVPFLRDAALADDQTHVSSVTLDALQRVDPTEQVHGIAQLMANCPLRTADDVVASFEQFDRSGAAAQLSVTAFGWQNPWWASELTPAGAMAPIFPERMTSRSQDLPALFCPTGAIWWARPEVLRQTGTFHVPGRTGWVIPWQRAVDIDTEEDWQMAEQLLRLSRAGEPTHVC
jgi:N-acylneuraminate cytidylyltransferase